MELFSMKTIGEPHWRTVTGGKGSAAVLVGLASVCGRKNECRKDHDRRTTGPAIVTPPLSAYIFCATNAHVAELLGHQGTAMLHRHYAHPGAKAKGLREALGPVR
jgi:hypothetical protein